jgi:hypothetical protein
VPVRRCDGRGRGRCRGSGRHGEPTFPDRVALSLALISLGTSSGKATACLSSLAGRLEFLAVPRQRRIPLGDGKGLQDRLDTCQSTKDVFLQLQQATRLSPTAGVLPGSCIGTPKRPLCSLNRLKGTSPSLRQPSKLRWVSVTRSVGRVRGAGTTLLRAPGREGVQNLLLLSA